MRYSEYFEQAALLAEKGDTIEAKRLLREAERYSLPFIVTHMVLCARAYLVYLHDPDNAVRCLLEAECNNSDVRSLLEIAETYIELALHEEACKRCIKKAIAAATGEEDKMRLQEFFDKYQNKRYIDGNPICSRPNDLYRSYRQTRSADPNALVDRHG